METTYEKRREIYIYSIKAVKFNNSMNETDSMSAQIDADSKIIV